MNFIVISPHFPHNYENFVRALRAQGVNVLGIGDSPFENLSEMLRHNLNEYYRVSNMENYEEMYRAVAFFAFKYGKIDRLESHNEYWLLQDAKLRTDFNIWGLKNDEIGYIKYKSEMKNIFKRARIPVAKGRVFTTLEDAKACAKECGYPVVIKPDMGVGGADTYRIDNEEGLEKLYPRLRSVAYIMEEFLDGDIVTFDGLCDTEGNLVYYSSLVYNQTTLDSLVKHKEMSFFVNPKIDKKLLQLGQRAVKVFKVKERFFHLEFFKMPDGKYYGLEMNNRPPGGHAIDLMNYANNIDLYLGYSKVVNKIPLTAPVTNEYYTYYVGRFYDGNYRYSVADLQHKYGNIIINVITVPRVYSDLMGDYAFILKDKDRETIEKVHLNVLEKIE